VGREGRKKGWKVSGKVNRKCKKHSSGRKTKKRVGKGGI